MGRESDHKIVRDREFPKKINKAIEKWDTQHLIKLRRRITTKISRIISAGTLEACNGWNNLVQYIDDAMDVVSANK
ncbi:MAG: hypothetical protein ACD_3C00040G0005 [uncultured bacterium (gcode 4)]|uniref:Uncharacterized protein n=1 Tax=uncultured bacterium (gcode 4) TaxID=1234023 RepID=K2GEF6_9BACT|nr:MAG: hypothetical protein ACD_3C00040G0005 [uncultured bacterium (gcode 4)]